jgi:alpha-D-ribose 1-methylphosphonate 5-triphosphate diphosphatase
LNLANALRVLPREVRRGSLKIVNGVIADIAEGASVPAGAHDCRGDYVSPALAEPHTDNLERHIRPRPKVGWRHAAAIIAHDAELASAGITTVFDAMRVGSISRIGSRCGRCARSLASKLLEMRGEGVLKSGHYLHQRRGLLGRAGGGAGGGPAGRNLGRYDPWHGQGGKRARAGRGSERQGRAGHRQTN